MADYKESSITGKTWQRCSMVSIHNPYKALPIIYLQEEEVTEADGKFIAVPVQGLQFPFDPSRVIPLRNPLTGEPLGSTMTFQQMYIGLWSLYIDAAIRRDLSVSAAAEASANAELQSATAMKDALTISKSDAEAQLASLTESLASFVAEHATAQADVVTKTGIVEAAADSVAAATLAKETAETNLAADPENQTLIDQVIADTEALDAALAAKNTADINLASAQALVSSLEAKSSSDTQRKAQVEADAIRYTAELADATTKLALKVTAAEVATATATAVKAAAKANGVDK